MVSFMKMIKLNNLFALEMANQFRERFAFKCDKCGKQTPDVIKRVDACPKSNCLCDFCYFTFKSNNLKNDRLLD